jgi:HK97 family phage major capsid protein
MGDFISSTGRYVMARPMEYKDATTEVKVTPEVKKLFEDLQVGFNEFKTKNDERLKQIEQKGSADVVTTQAVETINAKLGEMQAKLDLKIVEGKRPIIKGYDGLDREITAAETEHRKGWQGYFRKGNETGLRELEEKALSVGTNSDGGFLVPVQLEQNITRIVTDVSAIRPLAQVISISTGLYEKPINLTGANSGWVGEQTARPQTNTPVLNRLAFPVHEMYAMPGATQTLLDDANINVEQWLADEVRIEFARAEGAAFVNGDGVAKPRGFMNQSFVADASYAWGTPGYVATGADGVFIAGVTQADCLIDLVYALKPDYRSNGRWIMNKASLGRVRKLKDTTGQYLWQPPLQLGQPASILGYGLTEAEDMPAFATGGGSFPIAFGDFRSAYLIVDRIGIRVLRDPFTAKPFVLFYTTKRVGGGVQNYEAYKVLKAFTS